MKKIVALLTAAVMTISLIPACVSADAEEEITLKLFHRYATDSQTAFMDEIIAAYEEQNPNIHVEVSTSGRDEYRDKLKVVLGSNDIPDVFFSYAYENVNEIIREGKCLPLTEYYNADSEWQEYYIDGVLDGYTYEDELYGAPYRVSISIIIYNKDYYEQLGLKVPETMDELFENCQALQDAGIQPFTLSNAEQWPAPQWIGAFNDKLVAPEVLATDYALEGDWSDEGYLKAFDLMSTMLSYGSEDVNSKTFSISEEEFASGKVAMMWTESVAVGDISTLNPDCNFGCFAIPSIPDGAGDNTGVQGGPEGFVVSADTEYPEEAAKLVKYLSSPEVGMKMIASELNWFNGAAGVVDMSNAEELTPIQQAYTYLENSTGLLAFLDTAMNSSVANDYIAQMQSYIDGGVTAEEVMASVREESEFLKD